MIARATQQGREGYPWNFSGLQNWPGDPQRLVTAIALSLGASVTHPKEENHKKFGKGEKTPCGQIKEAAVFSAGEGGQIVEVAGKALRDRRRVKAGRANQGEKSHSGRRVTAIVDGGARWILSFLPRKELRAIAEGFLPRRIRGLASSIPGCC